MSASVDLLLFCPNCNVQHVDQPRPDICETCGKYQPGCLCERFKPWLNEPHKSHRCENCNHVWRPADVPTNGILETKTKGQRDGDPRPHSSDNGFQGHVLHWLIHCFGEKIASDKIERNHRFLEESLELVQSLGCTASEAHQLVEYVFSRPVGDPHQEVGGVMVTLACLCSANDDLNMHEAGDVELKRIWGKIDQIRAKQAAKPQHSPLPE